jgi:hypothetical protein
MAEVGGMPALIQNASRRPRPIIIIDGCRPARILPSLSRLIMSSASWVGFVSRLIPGLLSRATNRGCH